MPPHARPPQDRFWAFVEKTPTCWLWTGAATNGYGRFQLARGRTVFAHRFAYETEVKPIPQGLTIDHLCRVPLCVRPEHLEPVTIRENVLRGETVTAANAAKTACPQGHPFDAVNTYPRPDGARGCRECMRAASREWKRSHR